MITMRKVMTQQELLAELKADRKYNGFNLEREMVLADKWIKRHPGREFTKRFFINWLNKVEAPICMKPTETIMPKFYLPALFGAPNWNCKSPSTGKEASRSEVILIYELGKNRHEHLKQFLTHYNLPFPEWLK